MNFILSIIKSIKFKPIKKFKKFERHSYGGGGLLPAATDLPVHGRQHGLFAGEYKPGDYTQGKVTSQLGDHSRIPILWGNTVCS